ncbi:MAG TPA: pseudouridine synthase [Bacteroidia bacterium]|nr:pseudouridine synthase [Bacteroidia bacterium]
MRKDNSRRNRSGSFGGKKRGDSEKRNFRKREDGKTFSPNSFDRPKKNFRDDKPADDSGPGQGRSYPAKPNENSFDDRKKYFRDVKPEDDSSSEQKRSYYGKSNENSFGGRRKNFRDDRKQNEPPSFMHKKKYADRAAKVEKNKRKFDYGQEFTNKEEHTSKEGFERKEKRNTFFDKRKTFTRREPFSDKRREDSPEQRERKPFRGDRRNKFDGDRKHFNSRGSQPETRNEKPGTDLIRLNKYISNSGICSRREADDMITAGVISVNDEIITRLGTKISPADVVKYNNETLRRERNVYVLLNKPKDYITTSDDPEKRNTVMELVADACKERIYPVGRLDRNTTGVLLFTNDGELTKKLTHPSSNIKKIYHVELDRNVKTTDLDKIAGGIELEDGIAHVDAISYDDPMDKSHVGIELHSGKNRVVRRIFEALEYEVKKLDRVYFAGLTKKDLPRGRWRFLTDLEVSSLKMKPGRKPRVKTE